jgi:hypothetical protein
MPTILRKHGFRLFFYSNEKDEPAHIHVQYQSATAKFWIQPVSLARNTGMNTLELHKAFDLIVENEDFVKEKWNEYFS